MAITTVCLFPISLQYNPDQIAVQELEYCTKKIYYDTVVFGEPWPEHLVKLWGEGHVVIGTDYPYEMGCYQPAVYGVTERSITGARACCLRLL